MQLSVLLVLHNFESGLAFLARLRALWGRHLVAPEKPDLSFWRRHLLVVPSEFPLALAHVVESIASIHACGHSYARRVAEVPLHESDLERLVATTAHFLSIFQLLL